VLTTSECATDESESGDSSEEWPTPTASAYGSSNNGCPGDGREEYATKGRASLETMARSEWQTPTASDASRQGNFGRGPGNPTLPEQVKKWPTPRAEDCEQTGAHRGVPDTLTSAVRVWPTPTASDANSAGSRTAAGSNAHPGVSLTDAAVHGLTIRDTAGRRQWITPTARDWKDSPGQASCSTQHEHCDLLPRQVFADLSSPDPENNSTTGSAREPLAMLNADWVFQLMGFPATWARLSTKPGSKLPEILSSHTSPSCSDG
jgi:hypothetical protein